MERVTISALRENTFYAEVSLKGPDENLKLDARPSDAIALALRARAPIFVLKSVLESAQAADLTRTATDDEQLKKWLENAEPEDFGEYEM